MIMQIFDKHLMNVFTAFSSTMFLQRAHFEEGKRAYVERLSYLFLFHDGLSHPDYVKHSGYSEEEKRFIFVRLRRWSMCTKGLFRAYCAFLFSSCYCCSGQRCVQGVLFIIFVAELHQFGDFYVSMILNNCQKRQLWLMFNFRFTAKMDSEVNKEVETSSMNGDVIEMDINYGTDGMSDSEVQSELASLQQESESNELEVTVIERPMVKEVKILATPKLSSVVVVPESANRSYTTKPRSTGELKKDSKPSKTNHNNKNGSSKKNSSKTSAISLVSMLSRATTSNIGNSTAKSENTEPRITSSSTNLQFDSP